jgi:hypothetical protein
LSVKRIFILPAVYAVAITSDSISVVWQNS